jgi:hypothetical protein
MLYMVSVLVSIAVDRWFEPMSFNPDYQMDGCSFSRSAHNIMQ